jgi:hypothetical protein
MRPLRLSVSMAAVAAALACAGCGGSPALVAADSGDYDALGASLAQSEVELGDAQDIAGRVLAHQIATAQGATGRRGLEALGTCALRVDDALARRSQHDDELAAFAARLRVDAGLAPPMAYAHRINDKTSHWRAAAARSLSLPAAPVADGPRSHDDDRVRAGLWRRQLMLDPSGEVRVAALRAAVDAADPDDADAVIEAARLDPEPEARLMGIQAAGAIGTSRTVMSLKDLWPRSDEPARLAIVGAWAAAARKPAARPVGRCAGNLTDPRCAALGQLQRVSDLGDGMPSLVAALELVHDTPPAAAGTPEGNAAAVVERMVDGAATPVRIEAIASAPLSWGHLVEAIVDASEDADGRVAAAALARLASIPSERAKALKALVQLAKGRSLGVDAAKQALVDAGDASVVPLLSADVKATSASQRADAAVRYAQLGRVDAALDLVADRDATVRARAACAILAIE